MKNTKRDIVISPNFQEQIDKLNIVDQLQRPCAAAFPGFIRHIDHELYLLLDDSGKEICGILDCKSFMEALLDTDVGHLWTCTKNNKTIN